MSSFTLNHQSAADTPTPLADKSAVYINEDGALAVKDSAGDSAVIPTAAEIAAIEAALALKAPLASPALTGVPTAPTASANTNTTQIATTAFAKGEADDAQTAAEATASAALGVHAALTDAHGATASPTGGRIALRDAQGIIGAGGIRFSTTGAPASPQVGDCWWNDTDKTLNLMAASGTTQQIGQELYIRARNSTGVTIANGAAVYVSGALGNRPQITLARADAQTTADSMIGLVTDDAGIANNADGFVTVAGLVRSLNTSAFSDGARLYLSPITAGTYTATKPSTIGQYVVRVGFVTEAHASNGEILVSPHYHGSVTGDAVMNAATQADARMAINAERTIVSTGSNFTAIVGERYNITASVTITVPAGSGLPWTVNIPSSSVVLTVGSSTWTGPGVVVFNYVSSAWVGTLQVNEVLAARSLEIARKGAVVVGGAWNTGSIPTGWSASSTGSGSNQWNPTATGVQIGGSGGFGVYLRTTEFSMADPSTLWARVKINDDTAGFALARTDTITTPVLGTFARVNFVDGFLRLHLWDNGFTGGNPGMYDQEAAIGFSVVEGREYDCFLEKGIEATASGYEAFVRLTVVDTVTQQSASVKGHLECGAGRGAAGLVYVAGTDSTNAIEVINMQFIQPKGLAPAVMFLGDSITEANTSGVDIGKNQRWAEQLRSLIGGDAILAPRGSMTTSNVISRLPIDLTPYRPRYVVVMAGTNDGTTPAATVYAAWLANMQTIIAAIVARGAVPILVTLIPRSDRQDFLNLANAWILASGYMVIDAAKAVSTNGDRVTINASYYLADNIHPNLAGHQRIYQQALRDVPSVFISPRVATITNASAVAAGTVYALTNTSAAINFGTTDPIATIPVAGTYSIRAVVNLKGNGATIVAETIDLKLRKTNGTAADISGSSMTITPVAMATASTTVGIYTIEGIPTAFEAGDTVTIFGNVSASLSVGTVDAVAATISAVRVP